MATVAQRIEKLREEIRRHDHAYYMRARPVISDREYDKLFAELKELEDQHPDLVTPDSPTQRVGGSTSGGFLQVAHGIPMMSVDNTYNPDQLREFDDRVRKGLGGEAFQYLVDPKIDGVAVSLVYEKGLLTAAVTRGDGRTGDDITQNVRTIRSVPLKLLGDDVPSLLDVRGEIVWPSDDFQKINDERQKKGEELFANPRNAAAGTLKQLDPRKVAGRGLQFIAHGFGRVEPLAVETASELFAMLREWGVPTAKSEVADSMEQIIERLAEWDERRHTLPYETDGLVIKLDRLDQRDVLGSTSRHPRWCIAYKFAPEQAESVVRDIDYQVGKLGTITPRAVLSPVLLSGTTVRHATLHNFDQVDRLDVRVGDTVIVEKAGEIIPQVVRVLAEKRPESSKAVRRPTKCPECGGEVEQDEGGVYLRCINPACPAQLKERLTHFAGRHQMNIDGLGEVMVSKMVDKGWLTSFADIYHLPTKPGLEGVAQVKIEQERTIKGQRKELLVPFGEKRTKKLFEGIETSKNQPRARLLAALNIRHVGAATAELLAERFENMTDLMSASEESLQEIEGIGPELARSIHHFFNSDVGRSTIEGLKNAGVKMEQPKSEKVSDGLLAGKTVVVTGTLESMGRTEVQDLIKQLGGMIAGNVSKKTDLVVYGDSPGSKLDKAKELGVNTMNEIEFLQSIGRK